MMRETDELLPTTAARIVDPPSARPRALALTLAVALCAASAIAGVAIPRSSGDGVVAVASSLKADAAPVTDASTGVADRFAPQTLKQGHVAAAVPKTVKKSEHGATALAAVTKGGLVQKVDPAAWASECLQPFQLFNLNGLFSNHDLIGMPSGLCTDTMSCAFEYCNVSGYSTGGALPALGTFDLATGDINELAKENGIALNLPEEIAFPKSVVEVVDAVKYAAKQGMPISVKTSGHSYAGSSTLAGSVNINMRDFPKYTQVPLLQSVVTGELPAVTPCDAAFLGKFGLAPPTACKLAEARGKSAILRVGGGELWDDAYRAVDNANYWLSASNLENVEINGGGSGTVSAVGGWMQGGGLSDGSERVHGFGADNVLELEMVLASGQHIKFGPTAWDPAPGYLYPKTTEVSGYCNTNVAAAEAEWKWEACDVDVPFADLWFAVRGGGGGSYGIVVAATYQLHKKRTIDLVTINYGKSLYAAACPKKKPFREGWPDWDPNLKAQKEEAAKIQLPEGCREVQDAFADFWIDLFYDPAAIGVSNETSLNCGDSGFYFNIPDFVSVNCHDGGGSEVMAAWSNYWSAYNGLVPEKMKETWDDWVTGAMSAGQFEADGSFNILKEGRYPSALLRSQASNSLIGTVTGSDKIQVGDQQLGGWSPEGLVSDGSGAMPAAQWSSYLWSALIPKEFLLQKNDDVHNLVLDVYDHHIIGGLAAIAHDQMSPLSEIERTAATQLTLAYSGEYWLPKIAPFLPQGSAGTILGGAEFNHIGADAFGPLKSDHTKYCPGYLTHAEREEQCVPLQEFVWGTDTLKKLQDIKAKVDPHSLFQCQKCVGFDKQ